MNWYRGAAALALGLTVLAASAAGAFEANLRVEGIAGEAVSATHVGEIALTGFSFGLSQDSVAVAAGGRSRVTLQALQVYKRVDAASVPLYLACAGSKHIPTVRLTVARSGPGGADFMTVTLTDVVIVACVATGKTDDALPTEQVTLNCSRISWEYRPLQPDGTLGAPLRGGWDTRTDTLTQGPQPATEIPTSTQREAPPQYTNPGQGLIDLFKQGGALKP